jgi:FixJ family two-component response regulator
VSSTKPTVFIIDSDAAVRDSSRMLLESEGMVAQTYASAAAFLRDAHPERSSCIVVDINLAGVEGRDFLDEFYQRGIVIPIIVTTSGKVTEFLRSAVDRVGATLLEKPYAPQELIAHLRRALDPG